MNDNNDLNNVVNLNSDISFLNEPSQSLKALRNSHPRNLIIGHLNINSIRNKFDFMTFLMKGKIDILMISESKLDESFPTSQFLIDGYSSPYRLDRNKHGGGILIFIRNDIISMYLKKHKFPTDIEAIFFELNMKNKKWLIGCSYNPNKASIAYHLKEISKGIDTYSSD